MGLPNIGPLELIIVLIIALIVLGPSRLPEMGNAVGKAIREFRKASTEIRETTSLEGEPKPAAPEAPPADTPTEGEAADSKSSTG